MKTSSSAKKAVCAYCGEYGPTSRDHVPPKNLFPKPRTADLITVPACERCHSGSSKDDDYFRAALLTSELLEGDPGAERVINELMRSLGSRRFDKIRMFNSVNLEQGYKPLTIYSPREVTRAEGD